MRTKTLLFASFAAVFGILGSELLPTSRAGSEPGEKAAKGQLEGEKEKAAGEQRAQEAVEAPEKVAETLKQIAQFIKDLDGAEFEQRTQATEKLCQIGAPAVGPLKLFLKHNPSLEATQRALHIIRAISRTQPLALPIDLDGLEPNKPLKDVLDLLRDKTDKAIVVDAQALSDMLDNMTPEQVLEQTVTLPPMHGVKFGTVLRIVLSQIKGNDASAAFRVREEVIEITTTRHLNPRVWASDRQLAPHVVAEFTETPLVHALQDLSEQSGITIVLDRRTTDEGKTPITVRLDDVPLDTAVLLLADMSGLKAMALENVLYVTSAENARALTPEKQKRQAPTRTEADGNPSPAATPIPPALERPRSDDAAASRRSPCKAMWNELRKPYNFEKGIEAGTPFGGAGGAINILNDRYNLNLWIDEKAFRQVDPKFNVVEAEVQFQKMAKVPMTTVLETLTRQVANARVSATYLVRDDVIVITTTAHADPTNWERNRRLAPLVSVDCKRQPLDEALEGMSQRTGVNVLVDPHAGERSWKPVSARLTNVALDSAVAMLSEMADLETVALDGVLFVTTPERAKELRAREEKRHATLEKQENLWRETPAEKESEK